MSGSLWAGVRVLVLPTSSGAASLCASLMAGLGATVTDVTPDDRSPSLGADDVDVLLVDRCWGVPPDRARDAQVEAFSRSGVVVCVLSPYGLSGPLADEAGSELTVQARAGIAATNGFEEDPPLVAGVPVATCTSAVLGLAAVAAALHRRSRHDDRAGELIDLAAFDAVVSLLGTLLPPYLLGGGNPARLGNRHQMTAPWNTYRTSDGWVVLTIMGQSLWKRFVEMLAAPDLRDDPRFHDALARVANVQELDAVITEWTAQRTTDQILEAARTADVPAAPIRTVRDALHELLDEASAVLRRSDGHLEPGLPFTVHPTASGVATTPLAPTTPANGRGADRTVADGARRPGPTEHPAGPLAGIRVLELSAFTSAPLAGRFLGMLGADVLKIEPPTGENSRVLAQQIGGCGYLYHLNNTDKRGCVLDIREPEEAERIRGLAAEADVFLTNLAPPTLERFGLDHQRLTERAPRLIYCAVTGFGIGTPRARDRAFDTMVQALSGIMSLTGFPDGPPTKVAISVVDLLGACAALAAITATLYARGDLGTGYIVNVPMLETAAWSTQHVWDTVFAGDGDPQRRGNAHPERHPYGIFATAGGPPLALDVASENGRHHIAAALGLDADVSGSADQTVAAAVAPRTTAELVKALAGDDVAVGEVLDLADVMRHPQIGERRLLRSFPLRDDLHVQVIGSPFSFRDSDVEVRRPAPALGADPPVW